MSCLLMPVVNISLKLLWGQRETFRVLGHFLGERVVKNSKAFFASGAVNCMSKGLAKQRLVNFYRKFCRQSTEWLLRKISHV